MKQVSFFLMIFLLLSSSALLSKTFSPYLEFSPQSTMRSSMNMAFFQNSAQDSARIALHNHPGYILPKKVLFFSALIPGTGELYCKSFLRSAIFFGIEATAWTLYATYRKKGMDREDEFQKYADQHWSYDDWNNWFENLTPAEKESFSHSIPTDKNGNLKKTQQYYEMIGKYNQFLVGWDDADNNLTVDNIKEPDYDSSNRQDYMDMRYDANKLLKKATNGAFLAMFNRILSAIDAAWVAKAHNRKLVTTSLRMENKYYNYEYNSMLSLKLTW
jgi:hypothetical protein